MKPAERIAEWHIHGSQRGRFAYDLYRAMMRDERIHLLTADLGYGMFDHHRDDFPKRFANVGASEQLMLGAGIGLAMSGKIPFCYSITPFLLYRPLEWIRNYLEHEGIPVRLVGSGLDADYSHDGFTHHAHDAKAVLALFPRIKTYFPACGTEVASMLQTMIANDEPSFIGLRR